MASLGGFRRVAASGRKWLVPVAVMPGTTSSGFAVVGSISQ